jgi:hypothetical protein
VCALRISYHLHKHVNPLPALPSLTMAPSTMKQIGYYPPPPGIGPPINSLADEELYYYSRPNVNNNTIQQPNGAGGYYYSMQRPPAPDSSTLQHNGYATASTNYVRHLYEQ